MSPDVNRGSTRSRAGNASSDASGLAAAQAALVAALTADADIPPGFDARGVEALARVLARKRRKAAEGATTPPSRWQLLEGRVRQLMRWLLQR